MKWSVFAPVFVFLGLLGAATAGWSLGRDYQKLVSSEEFATQLTSKPLGSEAVGIKPLDVLPVLKQIEVSIDGETRKFVVGEIKMLEVKRYGVRQELVFDSWNQPVVEIIRATEMNKTEFTKRYDGYILEK